MIYIYTDWELHYYYGKWVKEENVRWESSEYFIHYDIDCVLHMWEIYQWMKWEHCIFVVWERWSALIRNNENLIPKMCKQQRKQKKTEKIFIHHIYTLYLVGQFKLSLWGFIEIKARTESLAIDYYLRII